MGTPAPKRVTPTKNLLLNRDGSNLAQYLANIRDKDVHAFNGIVDAMRFVLDYATDLQPIETSEVQRTMYVSMKEREYDIPGWMLSTGTVRILGLLAVLRNPEPPPVVIVEEIENGLDPRTIHMVLDEIRMAVQSGRTQVILTTHSPYFLNLLPLQTIVLVERDGGGNPVFWRPSDEGEVKEWGKRFAPGELYTAGRFRRG
jgi:predicted ATPase